MNNHPQPGAVPADEVGEIMLSLKKPCRLGWLWLPGMHLVAVSGSLPSRYCETPRKGKEGQVSASSQTIVVIPTEFGPDGLPIHAHFAHHLSVIPL